MREKLEKELRKYKIVLVLSIIGTFFCIALFVYYLLQNDKSYIVFIAILAIDLLELPKNIKQYKKIKAELQETPDE